MLDAWEWEIERRNGIGDPRCNRGAKRRRGRGGADLLGGAIDGEGGEEEIAAVYLFGRGGYVELGDYFHGRRSRLL